MAPSDSMANCIEVRVWGDFACFTRPECKAERMSYRVLTPSAARGLLEAIFWKPEIAYQIETVSILRLGRELSVQRNEISERQGSQPVVVENSRQLRTSLILADVAYAIRARIRLRPWARFPVAAYVARFYRRAARGTCFQRPYLGLREFAAHFDVLAPGQRPIDLDIDLGRMLLDLAFVPDAGRQEMRFRRRDPGVSIGPSPASPSANAVAGYAQAVYFDANVRRGVVRIPPQKYHELETLERAGRT